MVKWLCMLYPTGDYSMRRIHKIFLTGCGYTVLILTLFYLFAALSKFTSQSIATGQFLLILFSGLAISMVEFLYESIKLKKIFRSAIHYFVLLIVFCLVFVISGKISAQSPAAIFIAIVIYTLLYFFILTIVHFVRKAINFADDKLDTKSKPVNNKKKTPYKSLYSESEK